MPPATPEELSHYSACDISDALLVLEKKAPSSPRSAGFLSDLVHLNSKPTSNGTLSTSTPSRTIIAPAFTVRFQALGSTSPGQSNIPPNTQWSDLAPKDSIVVVSQPAGQKNACVGGIHMARLVQCGARGLVVDGRVRDMSAVRGLGIPVWAKGTSTVGAGAGCKATAIDTAVEVCDVMVGKGDFVCLDEVEGGVVCVPEALVDGVLAWLKARGDSEDMILRAVEKGETVADAFRKYR